jgi:hypothetical protein
MLNEIDSCGRRLQTALLRLCCIPEMRRDVSAVFRRHVWTGAGDSVAKVVVVVEVLHHELDNLRLVAGIVVLARSLAVALGRFELDDTAVSLLSLISQNAEETYGQRHYLECALLECSLEIVRLTCEDDLVQVEVVRTANELAV